MFQPMLGTLVVAALFAVIVFVAAFAAEGRGRRAIRLMLGEEQGTPLRERVFDEVERTSDLDVVGDLAHPETREIGIIRA